MQATVTDAPSIAISPKPMQIKWIPFPDVLQLSYKDVAYTTEKPELQPFFKYSVNLEAFAEVIADKEKAATDRQTLVEVLEAQYANLSKSELVSENVRALADTNTFTVTTAHQPSLFTGPLYYIYKIISTIHLARQLGAKYPDKCFVPVFVTGGEDHDFEEINYINLFNKKIIWQNEEQGAVGQMSTKNLATTLEKLKGILGTSDKAQEIFALLEAAYTQNERYSDATIQLAHELFKDYGLVVANLSHPKLKRLFIPYIKEEIFNQVSQPLVAATADALAEVNFKPQAFPREINFFYLRENLRARIVLEDGKYKVLNTDYAFTEAELEAEIEAHPEYFSPNVIMRPLYQELILPNLAFIGGGGELAYWLERKTQFEHFGINFPMLVRRNSVLWIDKSTNKRIQKLGFQATDLLLDVDALIRLFVENQTEADLEISAEKQVIEQAFDKIATKSKKIDPTLTKAILAEKTKQLKVLDQLESRLVRAEKSKHETALNQIRSLKEKLFPHNGLQERHDNFLSLYLKYGRSFFDILLKHLDPLKKQFLLIVDE